MKKRLLITSLLILLVFIGTYFGLGIIENRAVPYDFGRTVNQSIKLLDVMPNAGYGKILGVSPDSIVFLDNNYNRVQIQRNGTSSTLASSKNDLNGKYFFLGGGALTSKGVYTFCGNCAEVYFNGTTSQQVFALNTTFNQGVMIDDQTMILRNGNLKYEFVLGKYNLKDHKVRWSNMNTTMKNSGGLATDGSLVYDGKKFLYFVNRYNSSVLKFDRDLKVESIFNTIDAVKVLPKVVYLKKTKSYHFADTRKSINDTAAALGDTLYVVSTARGKRDPHSFSNYVDAYNVVTGKYIFSYAIPGKMGGIIDIHVDSKGSLYLLTPKNLTQIRLI